MNTTEVRLRIMKGGVFHRLVPLLPGQVYRIGAMPPVDILLDSVHVAPLQATLQLTAKGLEISDGKSPNRTWHDGRPVTKKVIEPFDVFQVGEFLFRFEDLRKLPAPSHCPSAVIEIPSQVIGKPPRRVTLGPGAHVLGRDNSVCDVAFEDDYVSSRHAELMIDSGGAWLTDLGSANALEINEDHSFGAKLANGDKVVLSPKSRFTVELAAAQEPPAAKGNLGKLLLALAAGGAVFITAFVIDAEIRRDKKPEDRSPALYGEARSSFQAGKYDEASKKVEEILALPEPASRRDAAQKLSQQIITARGVEGRLREAKSQFGSAAASVEEKLELVSIHRELLPSLTADSFNTAESIKLGAQIAEEAVDQSLRKAEEEYEKHASLLAGTGKLTPSAIQAWEKRVADQLGEPLPIDYWPATKKAVGEDRLREARDTAKRMLLLIDVGKSELKVQEKRPLESEHDEAIRQTEEILAKVLQPGQYYASNAIKESVSDAQTRLEAQKSFKEHQRQFNDLITSGQYAEAVTYYEGHLESLRGDRDLKAKYEDSRTKRDQRDELLRELRKRPEQFDIAFARLGDIDTLDSLRVLKNDVADLQSRTASELKLITESRLNAKYSEEDVAVHDLLATGYTNRYNAFAADITTLENLLDALLQVKEDAELADKRYALIDGVKRINSLMTSDEISLPPVVERELRLVYDFYAYHFDELETSVDQRPDNWQACRVCLIDRLNQIALFASKTIPAQEHKAKREWLEGGKDREGNEVKGHEDKVMEEFFDDHFVKDERIPDNKIPVEASRPMELLKNAKSLSQRRVARLAGIKAYLESDTNRNPNELRALLAGEFFKVYEPIFLQFPIQRENPALSEPVEELYVLIQQGAVSENRQRLIKIGLNCRDYLKTLADRPPLTP